MLTSHPPQPTSCSIASNLAAVSHVEKTYFIRGVPWRQQSYSNDNSIASLFVCISSGCDCCFTLTLGICFLYNLPLQWVWTFWKQVRADLQFSVASKAGAPASPKDACDWQGGQAAWSCSLWLLQIKVENVFNVACRNIACRECLRKIRELQWFPWVCIPNLKMVHLSAH